VSGGAVLRAASRGLSRRPVQTLVVFVLLTAASAVALLGLALMTSANESFFSGFTAHQGADMMVNFDSSKVTTAQLAATSHVTGVARAAGPYPAVTVSVAQASGSAKGGPGGGPGGAAVAPDRQGTAVVDQVSMAGRRARSPAPLGSR
jgi:putative ABC transport system permease protein